MKRITVWIMVVAIMITGIFALSSCRFKENEKDGTTYTLNTSRFDGTVTYGESIDLSLITITKTENGISTEIPVDMSMITSPIDTTKVGSTELKLSYEGKEFPVSVTVKYRVQFTADGAVFKTIHTLNAQDLAAVTAPAKEGYVFEGWSPELPDTLSGNMAFAAIYAQTIPDLAEIQATYGDRLSDIELPKTSSGSWKFDDGNGTVGNAGKRTLPVSFVETATGKTLKTDTVTVNVAKRRVNFSNITTSFTYNGMRQIPTYQMDAFVSVIFYEDANSNYTDAGVYDYYFEVDDPNYTGELVGSYEITKAQVTVKINSYTIFSNDQMPEIRYTVTGFDDISLLGLSVTNPESIVDGAGEYELTATVTNPSIELTVEKGTLTVVSTTLDVGDPTIKRTEAVYEETLSDIEFDSHPNGKWTWKDPTASVGNVGKNVHVAVFTPNDTRYDILEINIEINVSPKELKINVTGKTTFTYDGNYHSLTYTVTDASGNDYSSLTVIGNTEYKNAGTYTVSLSLENENYSAFSQTTLIINKADPKTNFSDVFTATWTGTLKLSDFADELAPGYEWVNPDETITEAGTHYYSAIFRPADRANYNTVSGEFRIDVAKADASIGNVNNSYNFTYNGSTFTLNAITRSHEESELVFVYTKDGSTVSSIKDAGAYSVKITLPESKNHKAAEATTTVTVAKADNTESVITSQNATYGDKVSVITLPSGVAGTWSIKGADGNTTVGNVGTNDFVALFTPSDENYNSREVGIKVSVARKSVNAPTIATEKEAQIYTGAALNSGLESKEGYTVTDTGGTNVGTYTVKIALINANYVWSDGTSGDKTLTYRIVEAQNKWTAGPAIKNEWTFGDTDGLDTESTEYAAFAGTASALYGTVTVTYAEAGSESFTSALPTNAGSYVARFVATDPNATTLSLDITFTIKKKTVDIPTYTKEYTYTGDAIASDITDSTLYTVSNPKHTDVGNYAATVTLTYPENYVWADGDVNAAKRLEYSIVKATVVINSFTVPSTVYGTALSPSATTSFATGITYVYSDSIDGKYTETVPTNAGTYYAKAIAEGSSNLIGSESDPVQFIIAKAEVTILGVNSTYTKIYDTKAFTITGATASNGATVSALITKDGVTVTEIVDAGTYTVTLTVEESNNYLAAEKTVTVTVSGATNTDTVKTQQNAIFGNNVSVIELPTSPNGTWSIKDTNENTTVGAVGANKFTALFYPSNDNYVSREVEITVTVSKATVKVPIVQDKVYDGEHHSSGLTNTDLYTVTEDVGGEEKGWYTVTLTLNYPESYSWDTSSEASVTISYEIAAAINSWKTEPSIAPTWEYESTGDSGSAEAEFGGVLIEYKAKDAPDSEYSGVLPTVPGSYIARFTTTDENYSILTVTKAFEITKKKITPPTQTATEFIYTGEKITSGITATPDYSVSDTGSTDVMADIKVTVTLLSEYYVWSDGVTDLSREYTYSVIRADIVISDPTIEGWTYGEAANAPDSDNNFDADVYYVYSDSIGGEYTETVPTNAGTYYVKAIAEGTKNLNEAESSPVSFVIAKAAASIEGAEESYTADYSKDGYTVPGVSSTNGVALTYSYKNELGESVDAIKNAGTYTVVITLPETVNYVGDSVTVTVKIKKIVNNDTIPTYTATYGAKLSTLATPTSSTGTWSWKDITAETTVGNAGDRTHTLVFEPTDATNYCTKEVTVTVTVEKAVITTPTAKNPSNVYTNTTYYSGLTDTDLYTVQDDGGKTVGTYTATLTLIYPENYAWDDKSNANDKTTVSYAIAEGTNEITSATIGSWTYNTEGDAGSATAKYGSVLIEYKLTSDPDSAYSTSLPTAAGNYTARFTTTDTNCQIIYVTRTFKIEKATVTTPSVSAVNTVYNEKKVTSGIVANDYYKVSDEGGTNVGSYSAKLTLKDSSNYKWSTTGNSDDITLTYNITIAQINLSGLTAGWTYDNFKSPTVTTNLNCTVVYYYFGSDNTEYGTTPPTAVGNYTVRAVVADTANFYGAQAEVAFSISRATPTFAAPYFAGGKYYQNDLDLSTAGFVAYNEGNTSKVISGTFSYGSVVFAAGTNASSVALTFTPDNQTNYKPVTVTYNMTLVAVAYLNNITPYGTIKAAVEAANTANGGTVWVRPHDTELGAIPIKEGFDINQNVTLLLPYGTTDDANGRNQGSIATSKATALATDDKCITKVILAEDVVINNYGKIEISGILAGGNGGKNYAGQTSGSHAKLIMGKNSSIISYTGSYVTAYGFIAEETVGNGSSLHIMRGATLTQPFVLRDFKGGSYMYGSYKEISSKKFSTFSLFQFINVTVNIRIDFGGSMKAIANLYAGDQHNSTEINMIGTANSFIQLTTNYSYLCSKVDPTTGICQLDIYGGAKTNSMSLKLNLGLGTFNLDTAQTAFPLTYLYNITLNHNPESTNASSTYTMVNLYKLMPGASLTVGENVMLNVDKLIVLDENYVDECRVSTNPYPTGLGAGILNVYGTFVASNFNGAINILSANAKISIVSLEEITIHEAVTVEGKSIAANITKWNSFTASTVLNYGAATVTPTAGTYIIKDGAIYKLPYAAISFNEGIDRIVVEGAIYNSNFGEIATSYDSDRDGVIDFFYVGENINVTFYYKAGYYLNVMGTTPTYSYEGGSTTWVSSATAIARVERIPLIRIVVTDIYNVSFTGYVLDSDYNVLFSGAYNSENGEYLDFYVYDGTTVTFSYGAGCYAFVDDEVLTSYPSSAGSRTLTVSANSIIRVIKVPVVSISNSLRDTTVTIVYHGSGNVAVTVKYKIGGGFSSTVSSKKLVQLADAANVADANATALGNQTAEGIGASGVGLYSYYSTATIVVSQDCTVYVTSTTK